eukprot:m.745045 g.745045  ORF g.745045 m.745045 type:complete len:54 (-) comp23125_c1_seq1:4204-4365(-)
MIPVDFLHHGYDVVNTACTLLVVQHSPCRTAVHSLLASRTKRVIQCCASSESC